jgi:hypothetical protein
MDLAKVHITGDDGTAAILQATGVGRPQSFSIAIQNSIGVMRGFSLWLETTRQKVSAPANVTILPLDVPGQVVDLHAVADQYAIELSWRAPAHNADLAQGYMVRRMDGTSLSTGVIPQTLYKDSSFDRGRTYTYEVVSARAAGSKWIEGDGVQTITVVAEDQTPPRTPSGLKVLVSDAGAFLTWEGNVELDLAGYRVFRNDSPIGPGMVTGNSYFDPDFRANSSYRISAVDEFGNESPRTDAVSPAIAAADHRSPNAGLAERGMKPAPLECVPDLRCTSYGWYPGL